MRNPLSGPRKGYTPKPPKVRDAWAVVRRLAPYWLCHWPRLLLLIGCSLVSVGVSLLTPIVIGRTLDECLTFLPSLTVDYHRLVLYLSVLAVLYLSSMAVSWVQEFGSTKLSQDVLRSMRSDMMRHILRLDVRYFDSNKHGDLLSRFANDADLIKDGLGPALVQSLTTVATLVGMIVVMWGLSPMLTGVVCLSVPLVMLLSRVVASRSRLFFSRQQKAVARLNDVVDESIGGLRVIRSLGREQQWRALFDEANDDLRQSGVKAQVNSGMLMPLLRVLDNCTYVAVAVVGGMLAFRGAVTVGVIQSFLLFTRRFLRPVNMIATQLNSIQSAIAGAERIFDMLDEQPAVVNTTSPILPQADVKGRVEFRNVSFGYVKGKPILKDVSFVVEPGQVVAIVGGTGAGKTTIINLLSRFYDIDSGSILLDGLDIRSYDLRFLRDSLAVVLQEPVLFSDTVAANIAYGDPARPSLSDVRESAALAMADEFISRLPDGYHTQLLRQGDNVSNGQRQLLTVARAIHSNAPILVLDEATSNIDTRTEMLLQQAIGNLAAGRTCFIIAHRLSTIRNADVILVLHEGRVVEQGSHARLLAQNGYYRRLHDSQFAVCP